jgi:hypothetical protein
MVCAVVAVVYKRRSVVRCGGCHISTDFTPFLVLLWWGGVAWLHLFPALPAANYQIRN